MISSFESLPALAVTSERQQLPDEARKHIELWERIMKRMARLVERRSVEDAAQSLARSRRGFGWQQIVRKYYAWLEAGRDAFALLDRARWGKYVRSDDVALPAEFVAWWKGEQMAVKGRLKILPLWETNFRDRYRRWRAGSVVDAIDGLGDIAPDPDPRTGVPPGCSYRNMSRAQYVLTEDERAAVEGGENALSMRLPPVFSDRAQLYFGQYFLVDDIWHDHLVNVAGERGARRPLELHMMELLSGNKNLWGQIPIRENEETGKQERLKQKEMLWLLVAFLARDGFNPRGTTILGEHGTATLPDGLIANLSDWTHGKLKFEMGGMRGKLATFAGQYAGVEKGNFRFKAALESLGNAIHNRMQNLPGQVGKNPAAQPSEIAGLTKYNNALIAACAALPDETRELLRFPVMDFTVFKRAAAEIYHRLNLRDTHDLQGWRDCGFTKQQWRASALHDWAGLAEYNALDPKARAAIDALIASDPDTYSRIHPLSPHEVYDGRRHELSAKLPPYLFARILGPELAKEVAVRSKLLTFEDREFGPGEQQYLAVIRNEEGRDVLLREGETYQLFATPFWPEGAFICDAQGGYLGASKRWTRTNRADAEARVRQYADVKRVESAVLDPLAAAGRSILRQRANDAVHNAAVLGNFTDRLSKPSRPSKTAKATGPRVSRSDAALNEKLLHQDAEL
jgi:hypothetical protein